MMTIRRTSLQFLIVLSLLAAGVAQRFLPTGGEGTRVYADSLVTTLAEALLETASLPGLSVAVFHEGRVVYAHGFGFADIERALPVDTSTQFRTASVAKIITATALARLYQAGRIDLDAPIRGYVTFPGGDAITARMLAGHLAGIAHYQADDRIERDRHYVNVTEALDVFAESPRVGPPGAQYRYSTHGYTLLAAVIESAAGVPFLDFLRQAVFDSLGMTHTGPDLRADPPATMSQLYWSRRGAPALVPAPEDPSYKWAGGGLISRPLDLVRLANGYFTGFIDDSIQREMFTSQRSERGEETGVGIGWRIGTDFAARRIIHHAGAMEGARSVLVMYPDLDAAIATMTNIVWISSVERNAQLLFEALLFGEPTAVPLTGEHPYRGTLRDQPADGTIRFDGTGGAISMPDPFRDWVRDAAVDWMPFHRVHDDLYALVTPYGIFDMRMETGPDGVRGEVDLTPDRHWIFRTN
ncbi:MAG TPA: serine hydrolase domain-containing protein [Gemmatimonadales bacterium]